MRSLKLVQKEVGTLKKIRIEQQLRLKGKSCDVSLYWSNIVSVERPRFEVPIIITSFSEKSHLSIPLLSIFGRDWERCRVSLVTFTNPPNYCFEAKYAKTNLSTYHIEVV